MRQGQKTMRKLIMRAPKGAQRTNIEGATYEVSKNGTIEVGNMNHYETLKRHGYIETDEAGEPDFDSMDDAALITYIEEHGGDADDSMKRKKLLRLAREAYAEAQNEG